MSNSSVAVAERPPLVPYSSESRCEPCGGGLQYRVKIDPYARVVYVDFAESENVEHVMAKVTAVEDATRECAPVVFDPNDPDLLEVIVGGYRLHGMFLEDILGEE